MMVSCPGAELEDDNFNSDGDWQLGLDTGHGEEPRPTLVLWTPGTKVAVDEPTGQQEEKDYME